MSTDTSRNLKHTLLLHSFAEIVSNQPSTESVQPIFSRISSFLSKELGVTNMALVAEREEKLCQVLGKLEPKFLEIIEHWIGSQNTSDAITPAHLHCRNFKAGSKSYYLVLFGPDLNQRATADLGSFINLAVSAIAPLLLLQEAKNYIYENLLDQNQKIAHDLKKPINMIKKLLKNLRGNSGNSKEEDSLTDIDQSLDYADDLLKDIISPTQNMLKKVDFNLTEVLKEAMLESRSCQEEDKVIDYQINTDKDISFYGNRQSIQRAIINLVDNAVEATGNQGEVCLSAQNKSDEINISVSNTGSFIPENKREIIFEPRVSFGKTSGTGLGLAIVKQVINQHGGQISCSSSGNTTSFDISLPVVGSKSKFLNLNTSDNDGANLKVIVIDDDPFTCTYWQQEDYPVEVFSSPMEFINHFGTRSILNKNSVIITDYYFDNDSPMNGYEFAQYLKKQIKLPIVLSSNIEIIKPEMAELFDHIISKELEKPLTQILDLYAIGDDE